VRATIIKRYKGKEAIKISQTFLDAPSLYSFLVEHGVRIEFRDAVDDLSRPEVIYTTALNAEVNHDVH
jgi:hypothetical protein